MHAISLEILDDDDDDDEMARFWRYGTCFSRG